MIYKIKIKDIIKSDLHEGYVITPLKRKISRVRVLGTVLKKSRGKVFTLILNDGTGTISVKSFHDPKVERGDVIDVVGRVKKYGGLKYIALDFLTVVKDPNVELLRELEILREKLGWKKKLETVFEATKKLQGKELLDFLESKGFEREEVEGILRFKERVVPEKEKIIKIIKELDKGEGVEFENIVEKSNMDRSRVEKIVIELLKDGDIFEPRSGVLKVL